VSVAGRTLELEALDAALAAASPRVVVIEAPAAADKTALVEHWVAGAPRRRDRPYELAQARLALGQFLRRERRRRSAADLILAAPATFEQLQAAPAVARCDRELGASGLGRFKRDDASALTPQEITVAQLVASGHSNREVASDLQLSVKTVEVHLTRIYAKLGVSSRGQLAARL